MDFCNSEWLVIDELGSHFALDEGTRCEDDAISAHAAEDDHLAEFVLALGLPLPREGLVLRLGAHVPAVPFLGVMRDSTWDTLEGLLESVLELKYILP